ncbi:hypothetical protein CV_0900 [Chromobacterium violaceum ATCC 12472]|uniref:Uncharacterized protein n=1 Tax=Chromobacterium violaceum (strain ATCC 12472 / DSM 30191 / JCM 1249 / CCUG 213 / NBRC 12614 / NCIMB 9131 / NCTC 9757 / MK) TaxID=243365 RepID=Q7NZM2_CHRVO|nr:tetratricopeptide repeat protein [Chromobacterium violaceum]AAQ58574.1 hypothetical protein CV_0900 [Chromobacterium violaceum ATCC 12472]
MIPLSPDTLLAARLLAEGDLAGALRAAQAGLQAEPGNAPLWNLLGVCAARLGQAALAEQCWRQALSLDPATPDAHYNLGCLASERDDAAAADAHYRAELARDPDHCSSLGNLGNLLQDAGRLDEAETCFRRRLAIQPGAAAHYQLGRLLAERGRNGEAEAQLRACLDETPDDVEALQLLGRLLEERGEAGEAEAMLRRALESAPGHAAAGNNLGLLLMAQRRWDEAESPLRAAHAAQPGAALPNLASLLLATGRAAEAETLARQALAAEPGRADWLNLLGLALREQGRDEEAGLAWEQGLASVPDHRRLRQNLGYLQLARGDWAAGWAHHEARLESAVYPALPSPRWQGESLAGRRLLVLFEQGYGDAIQFSRYLNPLLEQGAARVVALCREPLSPLFSRQWPQVAWLAMGSGYPAAFPPHDCHVFSMSLPWALRDFEPRAETYLQADPALRQAWRARLPPGRNIGLVWRRPAPSTRSTIAVPCRGRRLCCRCWPIPAPTGFRCSRSRPMSNANGCSNMAWRSGVPNWGISPTARRCWRNWTAWWPWTPRWRTWRARWACLAGCCWPASMWTGAGDGMAKRRRGTTRFVCSAKGAARDGARRSPGCERRNAQRSRLPGCISRSRSDGCLMLRIRK